MGFSREVFGFGCPEVQSPLACQPLWVRLKEGLSIPSSWYQLKVGVLPNL